MEVEADIADLPSDPERLGLDAIRDRRQLASELHATVAQTLFAIGVEARIARELAEAAAFAPTLQTVEALAVRAREELYATLTALNRVDAPASLPARLDSELRGFQAATGAAASFRCSGAPSPLGPLAEELLRDTFAEALRNVRKHAPAGDGGPIRVTAELAYRGDVVELEVRDDGGARTAVRPSAGARAGGYLGLLAERAAELRGTLELRVADDGGASLQLRLPRSRSTAR